MKIQASENSMANIRGGSLRISEQLTSCMGCPTCHTRLVPEVSCLVCATCGDRFPVAAEATLPILLPKNSPFFNPKFASFERTTSLGTRKKGYRALRFLPRTNVTRMSRRVFEQFHRMAGEGIVLNIGSGERSPKRNVNWINLDIRPHANCEVVGDAHCLPFRDESIDAIHSVSVFEHLRHPFRVASEVTRVLRPGGTMICDVPFAYPIHGSPYDFFRYTPDGLKSIFDGLDTIEVCASLGPCATLALFTERIADALLPGKAGFPLRWITAWLMQPMKYLDPWIVRRNPDSATGFTILMRKPA